MWRVPDDRPQAAPDRTIGAQCVEARRGKDFGHLQTLAEAASLGGTSVLERDFVVTAAPPGADDEPGTGDAPVVRVEIRVDQAPRRSGQRGDRSAVGHLDGQGGQGGEPAFHWPQVERVELPLDLNRVVLLARSISPRIGRIGHGAHATAGSRGRSRDQRNSSALAARLPPLGARAAVVSTQWPDER